MPALRHDLYGHAAFVDAALVEVVEVRTLRVHERFVEGLVLLLVHGTVYIVVLPAPVIPALREGLRHVNAVSRNNGRYSVEEVEGGLAFRVLFGLHLFRLCGRFIRFHRRFAQPLNVRRQCIGGQRAGRNDDDVCVDAGFRDGGDLFAVHGNVFVRQHPLRDEVCEVLAVHGQGPAGGHAGFECAFDAQGAEPLHLLFHEAGGRLHPLRFKGIGANEFSKAVGLMRRGVVHRAHFIEVHLHTGPRQLHRSLHAGKPGADNNRFTHS